MVTPAGVRPLPDIGADLGASVRACRRAVSVGVCRRSRGVPPHRDTGRGRPAGRVRALPAPVARRAGDERHGTAAGGGARRARARRVRHHSGRRRANAGGTGAARGRSSGAIAAMPVGASTRQASTASASTCLRPRRRRARDPIDAVELFSAPGEGRESVEIARRVLREARRGVPFDRMAIALRAPQHYAGLLEHALERAGVPVYFERGTRRPHPAGRAFLALIACALDNLSARRFAEYLSLGQVPDPAKGRTPAGSKIDPFRDAYPTSTDEVFGPLGDRAEASATGARGRAGGDGTRLAGTARLSRAVEMGAPPRRVARHHERRAVDAPPERADSRMRAAAARAGTHRTGLAAHRSSRAQDRRCRSARGVRAADHAADGGVAVAGDVGGMAGSLRDARAPRAAASRSCAARPGRSAADGRHRSGDAGRSRARAGRSAGQHRDRPARPALRAGPRRQPRAAARPHVRRRLHSGAGRADVSAEAARGSAAARRGARARSTRTWCPRPSGRSSRSCSCGWPSARRNRGCTSHFRPWRSAKAARGCRRCTRWRSGAP